MTNDLYRLVYYSKNRILAPPERVAAEIDLILAAARRNNARLGITGALVFNAGIFAQVLEGSRSSIEGIFETIQQDERHGGMQILAFDAVRSRGFPLWSMAFLGQSRAGQQLFGHIGTATGFDAARLEGERVFDVIRAIAIEEETCAV